MPAQRPTAAFDPFPPDLDLVDLVDRTDNFEYVERIPCEMIEARGMEAFERRVLKDVVIGGKPLVIEGFHRRLDHWTFTSRWLQETCGTKCESARDLSKGQNLPLSIGHYLDSLPKLTKQWTNINYRDTNRQRIYLKDIDCPKLWREKLQQQMPEFLFYLNDSTGIIGGPGAVDLIPLGTSSYTKSKGVAAAGDLMSSLPEPMRADNLMCYIGHEGTYTPAHREMCASLGQNLMVETSSALDEEGHACRPGSSVWFMTETKDRHTVSEYWLSTLGHDIEVETHFAQINAWKAAPFKTYVVEQRVGDFILIPPLAPHQVWNRGMRTMKVAWNRTTVETLEMAIGEALPRARMVCRDEQYKNKAIVYFTLDKYASLLQRVESQKQTETDEDEIYSLQTSPKIRQLQKDFKRLFALFTKIMVSESLAAVCPAERGIQYLPYDSCVTCSYCRCNIFNRFLTCETCVEPLTDGTNATYDMCMDCFVMGRSCSCISNFMWVEQFPWQELTRKYEQWRGIIVDFGSTIENKIFRPLQVEVADLGKKTLAQICQEQLQIRPWNDPANPTPPLTTAEMNSFGSQREEEEDSSNDESQRSKSKRGRNEPLDSRFVREHVSQRPREKWKCATCTSCPRSFQYGSLWRMFDMMPQTVMEALQWKCPACLKYCSCGSCTRTGKWKPYEPRGTVLGHDTKKVADIRSVESLVDFSHSNLHHIKKVGDDHLHGTRRLERHMDEAARARAFVTNHDEHYVHDEDDVQTDTQFYENGIRFTTASDVPIDPMLSETLSPPVAKLASVSHDKPSLLQTSRDSASVSDVYSSDQDWTSRFKKPSTCRTTKKIPGVHKSRTVIRDQRSQLLEQKATFKSADGDTIRGVAQNVTKAQTLTNWTHSGSERKLVVRLHVGQMGLALLKNLTHQPTSPRATQVTNGDVHDPSTRNVADDRSAPGFPVRKRKSRSDVAGDQDEHRVTKKVDVGRLPTGESQNCDVTTTDDLRSPPIFAPDISATAMPASAGRLDARPLTQLRPQSDGTALQNGNYRSVTTQATAKVAQRSSSINALKDKLNPRVRKLTENVGGSGTGSKLTKSLRQNPESVFSRLAGKKIRIVEVGAAPRPVKGAKIKRVTFGGAR